MLRVVCAITRTRLVCWSGLYSLSNNNTLPHADTVKISIAAAGAVPPIIAMLSSPLIELHRVAAWLLRNLAVNGTRAADLPRRCG